MRAFLFPVLGFIIGALLYIALSIHAHAHDWYPPNCCGGNDCRPADKVKWNGAAAEVTVGDDVIPVSPGAVDWKQAPDGRYHICYHKSESGFVVYCFFVPGDA